MFTGFTTDSTWMNTTVCSVTSEQSQSSSRDISTVKVSSALLNISEVKFTKIKPF